MESILLIDEDEVLHPALERAGYSVVVARDGREGLRAVSAPPPDLVVTDIVMEGQGGIEPIQALRRAAPGVKIITMSGGGSRPGSGCTFLDTARFLGSQQTLDKPFEIQHLLTAMRVVLRPEANPL
jgi:DNA-binding response OmpR family regulator